MTEYQQQGIGGRMIALTKKLASEMGFRAILLCGDPDYYLRQGFIPAETLGIRTEDRNGPQAQNLILVTVICHDK